MIEYAVERYAPDFDTARQPWDQWAAMGQFVSNPYDVNFGNAVELIGYDLDASQGLPRRAPAADALLAATWPADPGQLQGVRTPGGRPALGSGRRRARLFRVADVRLGSPARS